LDDQASLDTPPKSMDIIKKNLEILQGVIKHNGKDKHNMQKDLIDPVKEKVYAKIQKFLDQANMSLKDRFPDLNLEKFKSSMEGRSPEDIKLISSLVKDINYLSDMQKKEFDFFKIQEDNNRAGIADVIPVTGLIISKICRLENEYRSVIAQWENKK